jgi:hypothetical protein
VRTQYETLKFKDLKWHAMLKYSEFPDNQKSKAIIRARSSTFSPKDPQLQNEYQEYLKKRLDEIHRQQNSPSPTGYKGDSTH